MEALFFLFVVGLVIAVIAYSVQQAKAANEAWAQVGHRRKLRFQPGSLLKSRRLTGRVHGCAVVVDTFTRSHGKSSSTYTRFRVCHPQPLGLGLRLTRQGMLSGVARFFGAQDIAVGDALFDDQVVVKGRNPHKVMQFLTSARRVRVRRFFASYEEGRIDDREIYWETRGLITSARRLDAALQYFVQLSQALSRPAHEDEHLEQALAARERGHVAQALHVLDRAKKERRPRQVVRGQWETPPRPVVTPMPPAGLQPVPAMEEDGCIDEAYEAVEEKALEADLLRLADRHDEAQKVLAEVQQIMPDDPELLARIQAHAAPPPAAATPSSETPPPVTVDAVCTKLFTEAQLSIDVDRIFDADFKGKRIEWEGTLKSAEAYTIDLVFGSEGGTKALFEVYELPQSIIGGKSVVAIVGLAADAYEGLRDAVGRRFRIQGTLLKVDSLMNNLFIGEGRCEAVSG